MISHKSSMCFLGILMLFTLLLFSCENKKRTTELETIPHSVLKENLQNEYNNAKWYMYVLNQSAYYINLSNDTVSFLSIPFELKQFTIDADTIDFKFKFQIDDFKSIDTSIWITTGIGICRGCKEPYYWIASPLSYDFTGVIINDSSQMLLSQEETVMMETIKKLIEENATVDPWLIEQTDEL